MPRIYSRGQKIHKYTISSEEAHHGMMAVSYEAQSPEGRRIFLKQYKSPTAVMSWYRPFLNYQGELRSRIEGTACKSFCYRFLDSFEFGAVPCFFQAFEFLDKSASLEQILERARARPDHVSGDQRLIMAKVFASGLNQLHQAKIVHADLKPANVMLIHDDTIVAKFRLRIIDMDFSLLTDRTAPWHGHTGYFGSPNYTSPEHLRGEVPTPSSDVFTLGLMLHELLGGNHPYAAEEASRYEKAALGYTARPAKLVGSLAGLPNAARITDAIHRCLDPVARNRPSALEVNQALNDTGTTSSARTTSTTVTVPPPPPVRVEVATPAAKSATDRAIVLKGATGEKVFHISTPFGMALARSMGPDSQFFAEDQFRLERGDDGWYILPVDGVKNETLLNSRCVVSRSRLAEGDILGVGREASGIVKLPMVVSFR